MSAPGNDRATNDALQRLIRQTFNINRYTSAWFVVITFENVKHATLPSEQVRSTSYFLLFEQNCTCTYSIYCLIFTLLFLFQGNTFQIALMRRRNSAQTFVVFNFIEINWRSGDEIVRNFTDPLYMSTHA